MEPEQHPTEQSMEARIARLESDVAHMRSDIGDIKVDLRALRDKVDGVKSELGSLRSEMRGELASVKVWGLTLSMTMTGVMLTVMARGFGWI
jgi:uncharacterized coiled-coil protein SlyX